MVVLCGCAATLRTVDGYSLVEETWKTDERDIRSRASFELSCPSESLTLQVLAPWPANDRYAGQVGVVGCDRRTVYVRAGYAGWVANSASSEKAQ